MLCVAARCSRLHLSTRRARRNYQRLASPEPRHTRQPAPARHPSSHSSRSVPPLPLSGLSHETHYIRKPPRSHLPPPILRTTLILRACFLVSFVAAVLQVSRSGTESLVLLSRHIHEIRQRAPRPRAHCHVDARATVECERRCFSNFSLNSQTLRPPFTRWTLPKRRLTPTCPAMGTRLPHRQGLAAKETLHQRKL